MEDRNLTSNHTQTTGMLNVRSPYTHSATHIQAPKSSDVFGFNPSQSPTQCYCSKQIGNLGHGFPKSTVPFKWTKAHITASVFIRFFDMSMKILMFHSIFVKNMTFHNLFSRIRNFKKCPLNSWNIKERWEMKELDQKTIQKHWISTKFQKS